MLYAVVFIVIFVIILTIWMIRLTVNRHRRAQLRRHHADPEIIETTAPRPTFRGTAQDVGTRVFGRGGSTAEEFRPFYGPEHGHRANLNDYEARNNARREGVNRGDGDGDGDPELPSYHDTTTISVPPAAYASPIQSRRDQTVINSMADEPPKYDISQASPASTAPPIVRRL